MDLLHSIKTPWNPKPNRAGGPGYDTDLARITEHPVVMSLKRLFRELICAEVVLSLS